MRAMPWALICFCGWLEDQHHRLTTSPYLALMVGDGAGHGLEWPYNLSNDFRSTWTMSGHLKDLRMEHDCTYISGVRSINTLEQELRQD